MPMIQKRIFKVVDWHLRNANSLRAFAFVEAENLRKRAREQHVPPEVPIKGKGGHGDQVARAAELLAEADRIQKQAPIWAGVAAMTQEYYAGMANLGRFYQLYYSIGLDFPCIAQEMGVEKTTLYYWRDQVVTYAAMLAVEAGLVSMTKKTD